MKSTVASGDIPSLRELLDDILKHDTTFEKVVVDHDFPRIGRKNMLLNACRILNRSCETQLILPAIDDVGDSPAI
jgi:two-component system, chemotaxis family, CheB/CheR fusion protein